MSIQAITANDLRQMEGKEALILMGCGGDLNEWVDGINDLFTKEGILLEETKFRDVCSFEHDGLTCLLYPMDDTVKLNLGKLAIWRIATHDNFGGTWLSDFVPNQLGGYARDQPVQVQAKPDCPLIGQNGNIYFLLGMAARTLREHTELLQIVTKGGNGSVLKPKWSSSAPAIVAVDEDGNITAVAEGNARITASVSKDGKETVASAQITVVADSGDKVAVEGAEVSEVSRNFILSQKSDNVADFPTQSKIAISDSAVNSHMIFAAGKGTGLRAKAWELSGTITKEDVAKSMFMSFGVIDQNGKEQWFCILDDCMSLQRYWNWWDTQYECDGIHVIRNDAAGDFFYNKRADLSFKIIVKDDIFKAYFGTSPDSLKLTWELPLTEDTFGGFEKGSSYQLAINTVDPNNMVISDLKTIVGDEVEFDPGTMPGRGYIRYDASTETYYVPGEDDYVKDGYCYKLVTEKPESDYFEISMAVTPDTDAVRGEWSDSVTTGIGFVLEQNGQTVLFMYESKWNVHTLVNGKRDNTVEDVYSYNCGSDTCGVGLEAQGGSDAAVYKKAGVKVYVKLIYDHGKMWLLKSDDGVSWTKINGKPYTLERLNGNGEYTFDANKGFRLGFGTYIGGSDQHKSGSGKVQEVKVSYDKVKGTADEDVIIYDENNDSYTILGAADGIPDGGYSVLLTKDGSVNFEIRIGTTPYPIASHSKILHMFFYLLLSIRNRFPVLALPTFP